MSDEHDEYLEKLKDMTVDEYMKYLVEKWPMPEEEVESCLILKT